MKYTLVSTTNKEINEKHKGKTFELTILPNGCLLALGEETAIRTSGVAKEIKNDKKRIFMTMNSEYIFEEAPQCPH